MIIAIVVVLPAPLPPNNPVMLPRAMRNEISSTARVRLYCLTRRTTLIAAGPAGSAGESEAKLASFCAIGSVHCGIKPVSATAGRVTLPICDRRGVRLSFEIMTEIAATEFRHPRRHIRLDTILRLRWLAALGQLAAIFVVAQGFEFDVPVVPCLVIITLSALVNLALQIKVNPMQRLEGVHAAALLALNIVELAALLYFTGGLENPFSFLFLAPVL